MAVANDNSTIAVSQVNADVVFMRHALVPGFGDPSNFQLENCAPQCNLDSVGRPRLWKLGLKLSVVKPLSQSFCRVNGVDSKK